MTIEELYGKLIADDEMKESFAEAIKAGTPMEWVKAQGVDATEEELLAYVKAAAFQSGELSDEALDKIAGDGYLTGCNSVFITVIYIGMTGGGCFE